MSKAYPFRRVDNDEILLVDWETMMSAVAQRIVLADGVEAIRVETDLRARDQVFADHSAAPWETINAGFGCIAEAVPELTAEAKLHGFTGIEWVPDRDVPGFFNCKATSREQWARYQEYRNQQEARATSVSVATAISADDLAAAQKLMRERYPSPAKTPVKEPTACLR